MGNRSLLCVAATVEVNMTRYDELVRKEERLNIIENMVKNWISVNEAFTMLKCNNEVVKNEK